MRPQYSKIRLDEESLTCSGLHNPVRIRPMKTLHGWWTLFCYFNRYMASTYRLASPPDVSQNYDGLLHVIGHFTKWNRYIRIRGKEHIPLDHPVVFCANHVMLGDPLYVFMGIYLGSDKQVTPQAMSRDDVFVGTPLKTRFFDMDDLMLSVGIHGISRGNVTLPQMKNFVNLLVDGDSFLMFPGRSRSRSGMIFEYRDGITEPGGASFFLGMAQRRKKDLELSVVPLSRSYNPARDHTCLIYGEQEYLPLKANRREQKEFDIRVVKKIAGLAEVCVPQVVAALVYTVSVHHLAESVPLETMQQWVNTVRAASTHPYWDEEDDVDLDAAVELALNFLDSKGILQYRQDVVTPDVEAILTVPEPEIKLMKANPIQFLTNQLLHLGELTEAIQDVVLSSRLNDNN